MFLPGLADHWILTGFIWWFAGTCRCTMWVIARFSWLLGFDTAFILWVAGTCRCNTWFIARYCWVLMLVSSDDTQVHDMLHCKFCWLLGFDASFIWWFAGTCRCTTCFIARFCWLLCAGEDGPSQMALEDLAMFRTIPDCTVFYPSDAVSTERAVELAANTKGMCFIRTSRPNVPVIYSGTEPFKVGEAKVRACVLCAFWHLIRIGQVCIL